MIKTSGRARGRSGIVAALTIATLVACDPDVQSGPAAPPGDRTQATLSPADVGVPVRADRLHTDSAEQTADEIIRRREFSGHGVMRDGTLLTVWDDGRGFDGSAAGVRRAYRLQSPSGDIRTGRLPDGGPGWFVPGSSVRTTRAGFVILGSPDVFLSPEGSMHRFRPHPPATRDRPFESGDVLVSSVDGLVRVLRPRTRTEHVVRPDRDVRPLALGGGTLYAYLDPPRGLRFAPVRVGSWNGERWTEHAVGTFFDLDGVADGPRAAAWVCDEGGHGSGGAGRACASRGFAVSTDGGASWRQLSRPERGFGEVDAAVATGGRLYVDAYPHGYWQSVDDSWTRFERLDLPRDAVLHAEDGFMSASVDRKDGPTILRVDEDGTVTDRWTVRVPKGPAPGDPDYGFAQLAGSGDGSVVVRAGGMRAQSRLVRSTGEVAAGRWPLPLGLSQGFLAIDRKQLDASTVLTADGGRRPTTLGPPSDLMSGDSLLTTGSRIPYLDPPTYRHERLWSFRPTDATLRQLPMPGVRPGGAVGAVVDQRGQGWVVQGRSLWHSDHRGGSWQMRRLPHPAWPGGIETAGRRVLLLMHSRAGDLARILSPQGEWRSVALPTALPSRADVWLLADGRLLVGPVGGRFWRGVSPANIRFEVIPSGPIAQVTTAGELLYGVPLSPELELRTPLPLTSDWGRVWVSRDGGSTWQQVTE